MTITMTPAQVEADWWAWMLGPDHVPTKHAVRDLPVDQRRAYMREAARKHRAAQKEAKAAATPEPTKPNIRHALGDAALALLATDGPGAEEVRRVLSVVFPGQPGLVLSIAAQARTGELKPKLLDARMLARKKA